MERAIESRDLQAVEAAAAALLQNISSSYLNIAIEANFFRGLHLLLHKNVDLNICCPKRNEYPIHTAVRLGNLDAVKLLFRHGAEPTSTVYQNEVAMTPFCFAIVHNRLPIAKWFLDSGYNIEIDEQVVGDVFASGSKRMLHFFLNHYSPQQFLTFAHQCMYVPLLAAVGEMVQLPMIHKKRGNFIKYVRFFYYCMRLFPKPVNREILNQVSVQLVGLAFVSGQFEIATEIISDGYNFLELDDLCFYANLFPGFSRVLKSLYPKIENPDKFISNYSKSPTFIHQSRVVGEDEFEEFIFWLKNQQHQPLPLLDQCKYVCRKFCISNDQLPLTLIQYVKRSNY